MLCSDQIGTLIPALGTGIGTQFFNIEKLRYHKIIIMTDADVDDSHIRTLLLKLFYRNMREIIDNDYLYIAQPPLYEIKRDSKELYFKDQHALEEFLVRSIISDSVIKLCTDVEITDSELEQFIFQMLKFIDALKVIDPKFDINIAECLAIHNLLSLDIFDSAAQEK